MNPQWHDEFVALCALFTSGELTEEEWALLQVHLAYCESCRVTFRQYKQISADVIPAMAASAYSESVNGTEASSFSIQAAEQRLMSRLASASASQESKPKHNISWRIPAGLIAAGVSCLIGLHLVRSRPQSAIPAATKTKIEPPETMRAPTTAEAGLRPKLELAQGEIATLRRQLVATEDQYRQSSSTAANIKQQLAAEQDERKRLGEERDTLSQQLSAVQVEAASLRDKSADASAMLARQVVRETALETRLRDLNSALDEKDRMLALDKELLSHDRDIRDLIGARNLYIADIYDVAQTGKTATPFGRVFYTKDRSLVFYGYDLDKQPGLKQSVAFQAWGSGDDKQNVSLGLFYQDETHKRWVLSFNDTKTLARLNMVFVTAEPEGGSSKPTGKPLLLAYLQVQPNHP